MLLLIAAVAQADCTGEPSTAADLEGAIGAAEVAFARLEEDEFSKQATWASSVLECMSVGLKPDQAAAWHRLQGLDAFLSGDRAAVVTHFQAARAADPDYAMPAELAPATHPLRADFDLASNLTSPTRELARPKVGALVIDGLPTTAIPTTRPYVFQHVDRIGNALKTASVGVGQQPPLYPARPTSTSTGGGGGPKVNVPLLAGGGGGALVAGVLYGVAAGRAATFDDPTTPKGDLPGLRKQTNSLVAASAGVGMLAASAVAVSFVWVK